jgi:uncharacterized protein YfaS (alpha-2-macroglobulin family)
MPVKRFPLKKLLLLFALLCFYSFAAAQNYQEINSRIDSLAKIGLSKSALQEVDKLEQLAQKNKNASMQVKAVLYRITFQAAVEENSLVVSINSLKSEADRADYPVKPVLQSLLATMYRQYYQANRWQFNQRTKIDKADNDFTKWDLQTVNNEISRLLKLSLLDYKQEQNTPVDVLDGVLEGDHSTRYLRPTLYDLLVQRALDFFLADEPALTRPKQPFILNDLHLFSNSQAFASLQVATADTSSTFYQGIKYLQQATLFHLQKQNEAALADIDLKRLEFLYTHATVTTKRSLYLRALHRITEKFSSSPVSADAMVLLGKYYRDKDSLKTALGYFAQAAVTYPESLGGKNAAQYIRQIRQKELLATIEDVNVPDKSLLVMLNYRNVKTARVTIYKIWATQYNEMANIPRDNSLYINGTVQASEGVLNYLKKLKPFKVDDLQLPDLQDYRNHTTEFKIDPLKTGIYVVIVQDTLSDSPVPLQLTTFKVSNLSFVTRRNADTKIEIRVMDRETGAPMPGVQVTVAESVHSTTDANGTCFADIYNKGGYSVKLTTVTDTLYTGKRFSPVVFNNNTTTNRTVFFTDRQMYRPGQTVYFKGLHIQIQNGKSNLLTNEKMTVDIKDNNNKSVISIPVTTNEFGTFSGTFIIPQNILNGMLYINTGDGVKYISIEEYKRPSFSVFFLPVKYSYRPNDSVTVQGNVKAYSGYGISQARVAYHITRNNLPGRNQPFKYVNPSVNSNEIIADTVKTNNKGEFEIKFKAIIDDEDQHRKQAYQYIVSADVTDGSGETRLANSSVIVADNNLTIAAHVPAEVSGRDSVKISAEINNLNGVMQKGTVELNVYALKQPDHLFKKRLWNKPDQYLLSIEQYKKDFPDFAYGNEDKESTWSIQNKVEHINLNADGKLPVVFNLDVLKKQPSGTYKVIIKAKGEHGDTASVIHYMYLVNEPAKLQRIANWVTYLSKGATPEKPAEILLGTGKSNHVLMEKYNGSQLLSSKWLNINSEKQQLIKIPVATGENNVSIQFLMVYQNRMYNSRQTITKKNDDDGLNIRFLTFKNKLQPGEKEQWKLQISGKNNEKQAAEMVADLYDASLDALSGADNWRNILNSRFRYEQLYFNWDNGFVGEVRTLPIKYTNYFFNPSVRNYEQLNVFNNEPNRVFMSVGLREFVVADPGQRNLKGDKNADVTIDEPVGTSSLKMDAVETVVTAYGLQRKEELTASVRSMNDMVNRGVQIIDDYGDQANLPGGIKPVATRKNFNETAFFYPQLHTNEKGEILIDFTIPEALTTWRFKGFAHTKDLKTGYIDQEVVTQKELSITANSPRFLREGDTIIISARLANLTASALKGKVQLQLFNALNMQPVNLFVNIADAQQSFDVAAAANKAISFKLFIPAGLTAITYRLTAEAGNYGDGEENTLPVLPNSMLVTESMPMTVRAGQTRSFTFDKLISKTSTTLKSKTLTLEYTQNPAWYAVQALPYMMEFPYECSEQVFNRYYANSLATSLVNKMPVIKQVFDQWKISNSPELLSNLEKNQELKSTLIEETPWLQDAMNETEQKKRIALLFDLNKMSYEQQLNLNKLQQKQLPDGSFPWFGGDEADRYITQDVLAGIGQLYHLGITDTKNLVLKDIADKTMAYLDNTIINDASREKDQKTYEKRELSPLEIHSYYAQSYFTARNINTKIQELLTGYLSLAEKQWPHKSVYEQALIALTMQRNKRPAVAAAIIKSLLETAQHSDDMGMYWSKNQLGYYWYQSPIETQSLMIELFTETGNNDKAIYEMKIWLLRNKQTTNWETTKATAAACYALLLKGDNWLADQAVPDINIGGKDLAEVRPGIKADAGTGYIKTTWTNEQIKPELGKVQIKNNGKAISWGALHWQYLESMDKITPSATDIHLERKYFIVKQTDAGKSLTAVDAAHQPKTSDLLKVVVYLKAGRDFEYVQLKDMRPSGTEPVDVHSAYKYQDGIYYYQVTKDVATNFFISNLNKGSYVFEYQLRVAQPGSFSTGISTVQSMYAPEFNAHSEGIRMIVKP